MNDNMTTEVLRTMSEILKITREIETKNRETVDCISRALSILSEA